MIARVREGLQTRDALTVNGTTGAPASVASSAGLMLLLLALTYFLSYYDRLVMVVVGEMVKSEFALSDKQLSLLTGASFVVIYGTCGIAAGWLVDHYSRKRVMIWSLLLWSLLTAACGMANSFIQLAIARAGVGIGEAANVPAAISAIADRYPPARRPMALAIFYAGGMVGILVCFLLGTWLATRFGWRAAFLVAGPPGVVVALLIAFAFPEPVREAPRRQPSSGAMPQSSFLLVWRNRPLRWLLIAGAVASFISIGMVQWLPIFFLRSHGLSLQQVGLYFGPVLATGMTAGLLLGGWVGNRVASRSVTDLIWISAWTMIGLVPLYLLIFWLPSLPAALAITLAGTTMSVLYAPAYNAAWQTICDPGARGTAAGLSSFANAILGGAGCTFLIGILSDWWAPTLGKDSLRYALTAGMAFCLIAAGLFMYAARLAVADWKPAADAA
jgi:MFS family permease